MTATSWVDEPWLAFDVESTGIERWTDRVVEVAVAIVAPDGTVGETFTTIVDPGIEIPEGAAEIHGITTERARAEGVSTEAAIAEVAQLMFDHGFRPCVAFNAAYDIPMLAAEAERHRIEFPVCAPVLDPFLVDKMVDRYRKGSRKLLAVAAHYGVELAEEDAHGALADAVAAARVMRAIVERHPEIARHTLGSVYIRQVRGYETWRQGFVEYKRRSEPSFDVAPGWPIPTDGVPAPLALVAHADGQDEAAEQTDAAASATPPKNLGGRPPTPVAQRFFTQVRISRSQSHLTVPCWDWIGKRDRQGYGDIKIDGKQVRVHRWSYEYHVGPIPEGLVIDHLCRNTSCVNPAHLEPVTVRENSLRGAGVNAVNAAKTHCIRGHELVDGNLGLRSTGGRRCLACEREARQRRSDDPAVPAAAEGPASPAEGGATGEVAAGLSHGTAATEPVPTITAADVGKLGTKVFRPMVDGGPGVTARVERLRHALTLAATKDKRSLTDCDEGELRRVRQRLVDIRDGVLVVSVDESGVSFDYPEADHVEGGSGVFIAWSRVEPTAVAS